ncbi:hypothetical protein ZIOFF_042277 [Zingiber officinale]|uniref:Uncharacterized protein n=1 Tax=Zingiber officinale TaxID=94328 RepID=A0A8J5G982_ZINOF|nr:hypothetical protein ZIOFF_042277 [Zingiber officinale]
MSSAVATTGGGRAGAAKPLAGKVKKESGGGEGKGVSALDTKKKIEASGKTTTVVRPKSATVAVKSEVQISLFFNGRLGSAVGVHLISFHLVGFILRSRYKFIKQSVQLGDRDPDLGLSSDLFLPFVKIATTASSASKTVTKTKTRAKTEKKVYSLPGQKYDPPEEREPLRIFYESLSKQIPSSEMAQFWMMEHGLLSPERAKKAYDRKLKRQSQQRLGTPIKPKQDRPESSKKPLPQSKNGDAKARRRVDSDDDDFPVKQKKAKI